MKGEFKKTALAFLLFMGVSHLIFPPNISNTTTTYYTNFSKKREIKPIKGKQFSQLNKMIPYINKVAKEKNIDPEHLRMIVWLESEGYPKSESFEHNFYKRYIKNKTINDVFYRTYKNLKKNGKYKKNYHHFKHKDLACAVGLGQPVYYVAIGYGFRGTKKELFEVSDNLRMTAKIIKDQYYCSKGEPYKISMIYNTGRLNGNPAPGRNSRLAHYLASINN